MKIKSFASFNESVRTPVDTVRASLKADPSTAPLLSKAARVDPDGVFASLADPAATLAAVKRILLNNQDVIEYVRTRNDTVVSKYVFDMLRAMRTPDDLHEWIDSLAEFISDLLGDVKRTESGTVTTSTKYELQDWANSEFSRRLSRTAAAELASNPSLKPDGPVKLYRGILFNSIGETSDGKLTNGAKFLKQIRAGERIVDMEWDLPSSWTYSLDTAENFATIKAASSQTAATMDWLYRGKNKRAIDGELGVIVSVLARPDDVIVDMDRVKNPMSRKHGSEAEVIMSPGKYLCRIVKMWNKDGEVDPVKYTSGKADDKMIDVAELTIALAADVLPVVRDLVGDKMWPYETAVAGAIYATDEPDPARIASGLSAWDKTAAAADRVLNLIKTSGILDKELPTVEDPRLTPTQNQAIRAAVEFRVFNMPENTLAIRRNVCWTMRTLTRQCAQPTRHLRRRC